ncbi:MAG: CPBP family intramembrane metalloprotease [Eubacterium sp.]|nr:CPBP family intramembrane metalloprotease [Eubacterium sp.]
MDITEIKKKYSHYGLCLMIYMLVIELSGYFMRFIANKAGLDYTSNSWLTYFFGLAPIWLIGFPVLLLLLKSMPKETPEEHQIKPIYMIQFYAMLVFLMMVANLFGQFVVIVLEKISGLTIDNTTIDMISGQELPQTLLFTVIMAPILEEITFRKILIDRLGQYSKKYSILLSGLTFGIFHQNIHQFFYATVIGILFAYIYSISGRIRYTIGLHMMVNFFHGFLPILLIKGLDMEKINAMSDISPEQAMDPEVQQEVMALYSNPSFLFLLVYVFLILALFITGLVLLCVNIKKMKVYEADPLVTKENALKTVFFNGGMIGFYIVSFILMVITIILIQ